MDARDEHRTCLHPLQYYTLVEDDLPYQHHHLDRTEADILEVFSRIIDDPITRDIRQGPLLDIEANTLPPEDLPHDPQHLGPPKPNTIK